MGVMKSRETFHTILLLWEISDTGQRGRACIPPSIGARGTGAFDGSGENQAAFIWAENSLSFITLLAHIMFLVLRPAQEGTVVAEAWLNLSSGWVVF